jgi:hypothetical protein
MRWSSRGLEIRSLLLALCALQQAACGATSTNGQQNDTAGTAANVGGATLGGAGQASAGNAGTPAATGDGGAGGAAHVEGCDFEDPVLARAVTTALGAASDAEQRTALKSLTANGASSLGGIECLPNLEVLVSTDGSLTDVSPLARLPRLRRLQVARNHIADLSPLSANTRLEQLKAASNGLQTLDGLTLPTARACSELILELNPLDAADVAFACDAGWPVTWGGTTIQDVESCNAPCLK